MLKVLEKTIILTGMIRDGHPFLLHTLWTTKIMNFTMFEGFFQLLATGGMVVSGSLFVLGVIYTGYERILLHH